MSAEAVEPTRPRGLRSAFLEILANHKVVGPVERPFGYFRMVCLGCDWRECTDHRHQAMTEGDGHLADLLVDTVEVKSAAPLADAAPASGPITALELRRAIETQCEVGEGSVAGYVTVDGVLDLIELANTLNHMIRAGASIR
ncbi:hypothetical protein B5P44_00950 [Mycobacterium sp. CBMA 213]|nr:hypothetical protein [Mycolicibacterium sp. CBMA 213]